MRKKYLLVASVCFLTILGTQAQVNQKLDMEKAFQKSKTFTTPIIKQKSISAFAKENGLDENYTFISRLVSTDPNGNVHERHYQFYKGIKIEFGEIITHGKDGVVNFINGEVYKTANASTKPTLSKEKAFDIASQAQPSTKFLWEDAVSAAAMEYKKPEGELVYFPVVLTGEVKLAYKFDIYSTAPLYRNDVYVDAVTGQVLFSNAIIKHVNGHADGLISPAKSKQITKAFEKLITAANVPTRYSGARTIETSLSGSNYVLNDATRGNGIFTYNSANTNTFPSTNFTDATNTWNTGNYDAASATKDNAALDAHWGAEMTYDFWKTVFNRNSIDNNGYALKSYVHYNKVNNGSTGFDNAQWNGQAMLYGDGDMMSILTALDVCGHEIGHGICQNTANLVYANHSGAMNEGLSDIWGACIENFARNGQTTATLDVMPAANSPIWKIGEDIIAGGLRSMSNPNTQTNLFVSPNPNCIHGTYYVNTGSAGDTGCTPSQANDQCGVHSNSGIMNYWFFLMSTGGSGTNNAPVAERDTYNVTGMGMLKAAQIAFAMERDYLTANATYFDARNGSISAAQALYCANSPELQTVTNAWNAVNVGAPFVARVNDIVAQSITASTSVACSAATNPVVNLQNGGSATITSVNISYTLDGGAAVNSTWTGSLAPCATEPYPLNVGALSNGTHTLVVTTTVASDEDATNNTKTVYIVQNNAVAANTINTFESTTVADNLVSLDANGTTNTVWERGTLGTKSVITNTLAGSKVYATKLSGNYPDETKAYLVSGCYNLTELSNPTLKFDMGFDLEQDYDVLYMQYSIDGGTTWSNLGSGTSSTWYTSALTNDGTNTGCVTCVGGQWTGLGGSPNPQGSTNKTKHNYSYNLNALGSPSNIIFRFVFESDQSQAEEGVYIDNFVVTGTLTTQENNFETFNVWPNPSNGNVNIQLNTSDKVNVTLFDVRGRKVYNNTFNSVGAMFNQEVNFNSLEKGIYLLNVESEGKKATKKLIIN